MSKDYSSFAVGVAAYYVLSFVFAFFPAIVLGVQVCNLTWDHMDKGDSYLCGIIGALVGSVILSIIIGRAILWRNPKTWLSIIFIYLLTLWPFIQLIMFYSQGGPYEQSIYEAEFPGFDWWYFW